jgi:hypothetical protein
MTNSSISDIGHEGEKYVEQYLKNHSFTNVNRDIWQYGESNIKADSFGEKILVQVKTSILPSEPAEITSEEKIKIISRAASTKRKPYAAYVKIDSIKRLLESIRWEKLN